MPRLSSFVHACVRSDVAGFSASFAPLLSAFPNDWPHDQQQYSLLLTHPAKVSLKDDRCCSPMLGRSNS